MSLVAVVLLVAALVLLLATEWPRIVGRRAVPHRARRARRRTRGPQLKVVRPERDESDEFARSVERDLASLPTIDERDAKKR